MKQFFDPKRVTTNRLRNTGLYHLLSCNLESFVIFSVKLEIILQIALIVSTPQPSLEEEMESFSSNFS